MHLFQRNLCANELVFYVLNIGD